MVIRNNQEIKVPARELVPGDIVLLETGDIVPADLRLLQVNQLEIEESALTGESLPVKKSGDIVFEEKTGLGDRKNMAYMGTTVTRGKGLGVVVATGMETEMGLIAGLIQKVQEEQTPLQRRLEQLGRWLVVFWSSYCCGGSCYRHYQRRTYLQNVSGGGQSCCCCHS